MGHGASLIISLHTLGRVLPTDSCINLPENKAITISFIIGSFADSFVVTTQ